MAANDLYLTNLTTRIPAMYSVFRKIFRFHRREIAPHPIALA